MNSISVITSGFYSEKGSKFFSYLFPLSNQEKVPKILQELGNKHPESRHICYAYRLIGSDIIEFSHDSGEPGHSAGDPILHQLKAFDLINTVGIVARIYGGTKLGIPGLRNAYGSAIRSAIEKAKISTFIPKREILINYGYELESEIGKLVHNYSGQILNSSYQETCSIKVSFPEKSIQEVIKTLVSMKFRGIEFNEL